MRGVLMAARGNDSAGGEVEGSSYVHRATEQSARSSADATRVEAATLRRARDGHPYSWEEFVVHYGRHAAWQMWDAAPEVAAAGAAGATEHGVLPGEPHPKSGPGPGNAAASAVAAPTAAVALVSDGLASDGVASDGSAEDEMMRLRKRRNAVAFIKTTREYHVYQLAVAMHLARPCLEPDPAALPPIPKRSWEKSIQAWRNVLHAIDARWGDLVRFAESGGAVDGAAGGGGQ